MMIELYKEKYRLRGENMFQIVKYNLLIPFQYDSRDIYKLSEKRITINKTDINICRRRKNFDSKLWFQYCFKEKPIESNYQMANSPLMQKDGAYKIVRIEMNSVVRNMIGIQNNENVTCIMDKSNISFSIRKIRLLFINNMIGFIHIEIMASNLDESTVRRLGFALSKITSDQPRVSYMRKFSKDLSKNVIISIKQVIDNIINLQNYVPINLYNNRVMPYMQISLIGFCEKENKHMFFDSIQALSQRESTKSIDKSRIYIGREAYISRFIGDKIVCIFGDTYICGKENIDFLTNVGNGLIKTATENYTTIFAFLISLRLMLLDNRAEVDYFKYLLNVPTYLTDEDNIREFFEKCIWDNGWNLKEKISILIEKEKYLQIEQIKNKIEIHGQKFVEHSDTLKKISDDVNFVYKRVNFLVDFVNNELKKYLEREKYSFNQQKDKNNDKTIGAFIKKTSTHIEQKLVGSGNDIIDQERKKLARLFRNKWQYVMLSSQNSLVSATVLLKRCSDITVPDFDWSGVCICATSALEAELKRVFFDGLLDFMVKNYGEPCRENADEIYENWPNVLLSIPKYKLLNSTHAKLKKVDHFTMGNLPFLFGETGKLSYKLFIRQNQIAQSELMKKRMTEYLSTIVQDSYKENPFEAFYIGIDNSDRFTNQEGCFVWKCERIRNNYRNKAAHVNVMTEQEAFSCYQSIITKFDTHSYNAEITGVIFELFSKIDGGKLNKKLHEKTKSNLNITKKKRL